MSDPLPTVRAWVALGIADIPAARVMNWRQELGDAPRRLAPCAVVRLSADHQLSGTAHEHTKAPAGAPLTAIQERSWMRQATVRVELYGDGSMDRARELQKSLRRQAVRALFRQADIAIEDRDEVLDLTGLRDTVNEPRVQVDFHVRYRDTDSEEVPWIETLHAPLTAS